MLEDENEGPPTEIPVHVVGLSYRGAKPNGVFLHLKYVQGLKKRERQANCIRVFLKPGVNEDAFIAAVNEKFSNTAYSVTVLSGATFLMDVFNSFRTVPALLGLAVAILLLVTTIATTSLYAISVRSRLSQFAVLNALGFRRSKIFGLIMLEALIVCLGGGVPGVLVPVALLRNGIASGSDFVGVIPITYAAMAVSLGFAVTTALLIGLLPARRAATTPVLQGLTAP
jgi:ABC-type antimicrobial peptide transport system permease subunit